jgi:hypothetical protein
MADKTTAARPLALPAPQPLLSGFAAFPGTESLNAVGNIGGFSSLGNQVGALSLEHAVDERGEATKSLNGFD